MPCMMHAASAPASVLFFARFLLINDNFICQLKHARLLSVMYARAHAQVLCAGASSSAGACSRCVTSCDVFVFVVETPRELQRFRGRSDEVDHFKTVLLEQNHLIVGAK